MSLAIRASVHAPQRGASGACAPRSGSLGAIPSRKRATCHAFGMSAPLFEAIGDASTPEGSPRGDPPRLSRRAALSMSASVSLLGLGVATTARCDARPADMDPSAREALSLARLASAEPDAEIAVDAWDEAVRLAAAAAEAGAPLPEETVSLWLAARADCLASLRRWADAERAYGDAADALARVVAAQVTVAGTGGRIDSDEASVPMYARLAMAHDGQALAAGAIDDWPAAVEASRRAAAAAGLGGSGRSVDVPTTAFKAGMRGGAPTVAQRVAFNAAMARWGAGEPAVAAAMLDVVDLGPEPDAGYPQFWEARAARAVALWASGAKPRAEAEWAALCRPTRPNPPAVPTNGVKAAVNKAAQAQFDAYGVLMDKRCEDFTSGTPLPCDDAGIPGSGGSSSPCAIFTVQEARARLWPPSAVKALGEFLQDGPEFVLRASEMERARG